MTDLIDSRRYKQPSAENCVAPQKPNHKTRESYTLNSITLSELNALTTASNCVYTMDT